MNQKSLAQDPIRKKATAMNERPEHQTYLFDESVKSGEDFDSIEADPKLIEGGGNMGESDNKESTLSSAELIEQIRTATKAENWDEVNRLSRLMNERYSVMRVGPDPREPANQQDPLYKKRPHWIPRSEWPEAGGKD